MKFKLSKTTTVAEIRTRVQVELGIPIAEQELLFRGKPLTDDSVAPLNMPDLEAIVDEAGEDGLQMAVVYVPHRVPGFLRKQAFEDLNGKQATSGAGALHRAVRRCELTVMEELLRNEEFWWVNTQDESGMTALHTAAQCWLREACLILLKCDRFTAVDLADHQGRTALHLAAHSGDVIVVREILKHPRFKAEDVSALDENACTALMYAEACYHTEVAEAIRNHSCMPRTKPAPAAANPTSDQDKNETTQDGCDDDSRAEAS